MSVQMISTFTTNEHTRGTRGARGSNAQQTEAAL